MITPKITPKITLKITPDITPNITPDRTILYQDKVAWMHASLNMHNACVYICSNHTYRHVGTLAYLHTCRNALCANAHVHICIQLYIYDKDDVLTGVC